MDLIGEWAQVSMNHTYLTYAAGLKFWSQQVPSRAIFGCSSSLLMMPDALLLQQLVVSVCMFRMGGCPPTLMKFTTFVT